MPSQTRYVTKAITHSLFTSHARRTTPRSQSPRLYPNPDQRLRERERDRGGRTKTGTLACNGDQMMFGLRASALLFLRLGAQSRKAWVTPALIIVSGQARLGAGLARQLTPQYGNTWEARIGTKQDPGMEARENTMDMYYVYMRIYTTYFTPGLMTSPSTTRTHCRINMNRELINSGPCHTIPISGPVYPRLLFSKCTYFTQTFRLVIPIFSTASPNTVGHIRRLVVPTIPAESHGFLSRAGLFGLAGWLPRLAGWQAWLTDLVSVRFCSLVRLSSLPNSVPSSRLPGHRCCIQAFLRRGCMAMPHDLGA